MGTTIKHLDLQAINAPYVELLAGRMADVVRSGWYLKGQETEGFERDYAHYIGTSHCVACGNGLDALTLILRAYMEMGKLREGDEVIVPANTYIASILAVTENRLCPVLVEPDIDTLQIDDRLIEQAITPRTRALMIVHLYGRCAYTSLLADICCRHGLLLIEDNAQAHGCRFIDHSPTSAGQQACTSDAANVQYRMTGSLGHAAAHSFYPTKNLGALGDAGAVTTDDAELAEMVRTLGNYGSSRKYIFDHVGRNSRMDELQAAVLRAKLPSLDAWNARRKHIAALLISGVSTPHITIPAAASPRDSVWHLFPVLTPYRDSLREYLRNNGVETDVHYPVPPHRQQCYAGWSALSLPVTERIHREVLSVPCNQAMTNADAVRIVELLNAFTPCH